MRRCAIVGLAAVALAGCGGSNSGDKDRARIEAAGDAVFDSLHSRPEWQLDNGRIRGCEQYGATNYLCTADYDDHSEQYLVEVDSKGRAGEPTPYFGQ